MAKAADCKSVTSETSKVRGLRSASVVAAGCASLVHWTSATFPAHFVSVSELVYSDYSKLLSSRWAELTNITDECDFMSERFEWYERE